LSAIGGANAVSLRLDNKVI